MSASALLRIAVSQYVSELGSVEDAVARALSDLGALVDSAAVRHASRVIAGARGGRPAEDDDEALAEVRKLLETGRARSVHAACGIVARRRAKLENANSESIRRRLKRKYSSGA